MKYQCWFCGKSIAADNSVDPCRIDLYSKGNEDGGDQTHQFMWCHIQCLRKVSFLPSVLRDGFSVENKASSSE